MRSKPVERGHRRMQSCRNAKDGDVRFYRAVHPSGMPYGRGTLHTAAAGTRTLRAALDSFVATLLPMTDPQKSPGNEASLRDAIRTGTLHAVAKTWTLRAAPERFVPRKDGHFFVIALLFIQRIGGESQRTFLSFSACLFCKRQAFARAFRACRTFRRDAVTL
jgi:hypothetical protein